MGAFGGVCLGRGGRGRDFCTGYNKLERLRERASLSPFGQCVLKIISENGLYRQNELLRASHSEENPCVI